MASAKKLARIEKASNKANASPPKEDWPQCDHEPVLAGYCTCGRFKNGEPV